MQKSFYGVLITRASCKGEFDAVVDSLFAYIAPDNTGVIDNLAKLDKKRLDIKKCLCIGLKRGECFVMSPALGIGELFVESF
ncbi:hypothetical protein C5467_07170 [Photorhabdus khanii subsp. guanajuatensis]|uniref:Uncharacterized protein n=1 Tax=Photorhabdus khanii subsp. guanajuatensis TaxID=2100166 RepID=A0A4R4K1J4_9GAMM|nr:hypothetical protein C5467_07170 [Photorhabdus khanii subsp. guanajuatensis]